ncbi:MAG: hypothetical protein EBQ80_04665 [Proteobacteria bacterium]|nr:hypothetical protein [Pseudomonadota bacterium]
MRTFGATHLHGTQEVSGSTRWVRLCLNTLGSTNDFKYLSFYLTVLEMLGAPLAPPFGDVVIICCCLGLWVGDLVDNWVVFV